MVKITKKKFREALKDSDGNITVIAQSLGVARNSVYDFIKRHELEKELEAEKQSTIEKVKDRRKAMALRGKSKYSSTWNAIKSILTKSGDHAERQEIKHEIDGKIQLRPSMKEILDGK